MRSLVLFPLQVCAVGALLAALAREGTLGVWDGDPEVEAHGSQRFFGIADIAETSIDGYLIVDQVSRHALQIFQACAQLWNVSAQLCRCHSILQEGLSVSAEKPPGAF